MNQLGTCNFGAYARKMLIDGYIIKVDCAEQKKLASPPLPFVPSNPIPSHRDRGASASRLSSVRLLFSPNAVASSFGVGQKEGWSNRDWGEGGCGEGRVEIGRVSGMCYNSDTCGRHPWGSFTLVHHVLLERKSAKHSRSRYWCGIGSPYALLCRSLEALRGGSS